MSGHLFGGLHGTGLVLVLIVAVFLIHRFFKRKPPPHNLLDRRDSLEILKIRLASGEISPEEYHKLKNVLLS